jgi:uncharacterized membrane protein YgaE (UPF0421/DUF939 family)
MAEKWSPKESKSFKILRNAVLGTTLGAIAGSVIFTFFGGVSTVAVPGLAVAGGYYATRKVKQ